MASDSHAMTSQDHSPVAGLAHDERGGISNVVLGMLLFITSEVMFFSGLFAAYFATRANNTPWPPKASTFCLKLLQLLAPGPAPCKQISGSPVPTSL